MTIKSEPRFGYGLLTRLNSAKERRITVMGIGAQELLLILLVLAIGVGVGRAIASGLREDQCKIVGGIALFIGAVLVISGISSINSAESQIMRMMGMMGMGKQEGLLATIGFGLIVAVTGIVLIASKGSSRQVNHLSATKKCPSCAETIQGDDKFCPNCGTKIQ
ncbi:MAG: zinc ribbon domain-containing protein [Candidatus Zixiibacteriota bacterium]